jgi:hypothetical protein
MFFTSIKPSTAAVSLFFVWFILTLSVASLFYAWFILTLSVASLFYAWFGLAHQWQACFMCGLALPVSGKPVLCVGWLCH